MFSSVYLWSFVFEGYGDHRDLHVLTRSFPTRRSSDLAGFVPDNLETSLIDEVMRIGNDTAFRTARAASAVEGLPVGISSGAALAAAFEVGARAEMAGKLIVVILPSFAERYLSTDLFEGM